MKTMRDLVLQSVLGIKKSRDGWKESVYDCETTDVNGKDVKWKDVDVKSLSDKDLLDFFILLIGD